MKVFDGIIGEAANEYFENERAGAASDFVKIAINYEVGGFFIDLDFWIEEWDMNVMRLFDFFGFNQVQFDTECLFTWGFLNIPYHNVIQNYLDKFTANYKLQKSKTYYQSMPLHLYKCW